MKRKKVLSKVVGESLITCKAIPKILLICFLAIMYFQTFNISHVSAVTYSGPIEITSGGTYTGNWESLDPAVPAVKISTTSAVTIINSNIRSKGHLIENTVQNVNITVKNTNGYALNPGAGNYNGRFIKLSYPKNVVVENNYIEGCSFAVYIFRFNGSGSTSETVKIRYNKIKNIDGRKSNGADYDRTGWMHNCGIQLNDVENIGNIEIAWNEIINIPYNSSVGDVINMYDSRGTSSSYINIHNNYVEGGYYGDATAQNSGLGVIVDGAATTSDQAPAYINLYNNQVVNATNAGVGTTIGSNTNIYSNRTVNSGNLPSDGTNNLHPGYGIGVLSYQASQSEYMDGSTIQIYDNVSGWMSQKKDGTIFRQDYYTPVGTRTNCTSISGDITRSTEEAEYTTWQNKLSTQGIKLGVNNGYVQSFETHANKSTDVTPKDGTYTLKAPGTNVDTYYTLGLGISEAWFYDTMDASQYNYVYFQDATNTYTALYLGVYTSIDANNYVFRDVKTGGWTSTSVQRSSGWHKIIFDYSMENYRRVVLDGVVVFESTGTHTGNRVMRAGGDADKMYFDYFQTYLSSTGKNPSMQSFETHTDKQEQPALDGYYSVRKNSSDINTYNTKSLGISEAWFYDTMTSPSTSYVYFQDQANQYTQLYVGVSTATSSSNYSFRDGKAGGWSATTITRTPGWHRVIFDYSFANNRRVYIDGLLVWSSNATHSGNHLTRVAGDSSGNYFDKFVTYDPIHID